MSYYKDLRDYIQALEARGKLLRISEPINKDTQLHPLARLQFRGMPESERKAFLFEKVFDNKGKHYEIPVLLGALGASPQVYAIGMQCDHVDEIGDRWQKAHLNPIDPVIVDSGPVHEVILEGESLLERSGFGEFPIPISSPGWDVAPYITSPYWVTKDPETGIRNVGTYRAQIKSPTRTGVHSAKFFRGIAYHWRKAKKMGKPLEAAVIIGAAPSIGYASVSQLPTDLDEYTIAGGIAGEPVELVKCKTVDLEVPARAEIVIEGHISTEFVEPEAPFGEATGYVGQREMSFVFEATAITHRKDAIWQAFISQFPPSESSTIRQIACANVIPKRIKHDLGMTFVRQVGVHFTNGSDRFVVLQLDKCKPEDVWRALEAMPEQFPAFSKVVVAVDKDINPWDSNMVNWAITYRSQPHRDIRIKRVPIPDSQDYSIRPPEGDTVVTAFQTKPQDMPQGSVLLIDTTMKWPYPPISLPRKEYMDEALDLWQKMGLPELDLQEPWYGYDLGFWSEENESEAQRALAGDHYLNGEANAQKRKPTR
jgi:4-hydroxy-3-polyprenylbenzoate decarboxylase